MPRRLENITSEPIQEHTLEAENITVEIILRWLPQVGSWFADVIYEDKARYGIRLVVGTLHIESANMPLDIVVIDNSELGLDPTRQDDFSTRRCDLIVAMPNDMEEIRGVPVPIQ